jgi:hypothetical protein
VHELGVKVPEPDDEKVTVPVGLLPVTVAVQVVTPPTVMLLGTHETVVVELWTTSIVVLPELPACQ